MCDVEIRNPKHEIRNKFKCPNSNEPQARLSSFRILIFGFVSDFGFRISSFGFGILVFGLLFLGIWCAPACADGGSVRLSERKGGYRVTVFTAPSPFRAGPVDISVLVQDAVTGQPLPQARVTVRMTRIGQPTLEYAATQEVATNKLLHAAQFELPAPGRWELEVPAKPGISVPGTCHLWFKPGTSRAQFEIDVVEDRLRFERRYRFSGSSGGWDRTTDTRLMKPFDFQPTRGPPQIRNYQNMAQKR